MATFDLKVRLIPDGSQLRKELRDAQRDGVGRAVQDAAPTRGGGVPPGGGFVGKVEVKGFAKLLGWVGSLLGLVSSLDFILKPFIQIARVLLMLLFLPLVPILKPVLQGLAKFVKRFAERQRAGLNDPEENIRNLFRPGGLLGGPGGFDLFGGIALGLKESLGISIGDFVDKVKDGAEKIKDKVIESGEEFKDKTTEAWDKFKQRASDWIDDNFPGLRSKFGNLIDRFKEFAERVKEKAGEWKDRVEEFIRSIPSKLSDLVAALKRGFKNMVNGVIDFINKLPGVNIPHLAQGGIVTKPTLAMIGEKGPEAVVPLDRPGAMGNVIINFNNPMIRSDRDIRELANQVSRVMAARGRRSFS